MKKVFYVLLLFTTICSAQIDRENISFVYQKFGVNGEKIDVKFVTSNSIVVHKTINGKKALPLLIKKAEYDSLIKELILAKRAQPSEEEFICSHGNYLNVFFSVDGENKKLESSCISANMNSWSLRLLEKFLMIIDEKEM